MAELVSFHSPETVLPPYGAYSHAAVVSAATSLVFTAGQVGETPDGIVPSTIEEQYEVALQNIAKILAAQRTSPAHIVKLTTYLVAPIAPEKMRSIRQSVLGDIAPTATLLFVPKLAAPAYFVEIEAVAAIPTD